MCRFPIWIEVRRHQGIRFEGGYVALRGRIIGREPELHSFDTFDDLDEMLMERCLPFKAMRWIDTAG